MLAMTLKYLNIYVFVGALLTSFSCASAHRQLQSISSGQVVADLSPNDINEPSVTDTAPPRDTLIFKELPGNYVIDAAVVKARFRNVAERRSKVPLCFDITVPCYMQRDSWQLRFYPLLRYPEGREVRLSPIIICGPHYHAEMLRGYERYQRLLGDIAADSTRLVNVELLDIFIQRNIPALARFRTDSTYVADSVFTSFYGVSEQEAIAHYTSGLRLQFLKRKQKLASGELSRLERLSPPAHARLDTVLVTSDNDFRYIYTEILPASPGLKSAEISLEGEIYEGGKLLFKTPPAPPIMFYISSLEVFLRDSPNPSDSLYVAGVQCIRGKDYAKAAEILAPYNDFNTALAYICQGDHDARALEILQRLNPSSGSSPAAAPSRFGPPAAPDPANLYLQAILQARLGRETQAVDLYLESCRQDPKYIHRGNLDPEITALIEKFHLQEQLYSGQ